MRRSKSVPVGDFSSKSRFTTAASCSSVSSREKSISGKKFEGNTSLPCRLTTKDFKGTSSCSQQGNDAPQSPRIARGGPLPARSRARVTPVHCMLKSVSLRSQIFIKQYQLALEHRHVLKWALHNA